MSIIFAVDLMIGLRFYQLVDKIKEYLDNEIVVVPRIESWILLNVLCRPPICCTSVTLQITVSKSSYSIIFGTNTSCLLCPLPLNCLLNFGEWFSDGERVTKQISILFWNFFLPRWPKMSSAKWPTTFGITTTSRFVIRGLMICV